MRKISLVDNNGVFLGMGYMNDSQEDERCLAELRKQIEDSRIRGNLRIEDADTISITELGNQIEALRESQELMEELNISRTPKKNNFSGYNILNLLRK
jgi:hypothetical protein